MFSTDFSVFFSQGNLNDNGLKPSVCLLLRVVHIIHREHISVPWKAATKRPQETTSGDL